MEVMKRQRISSVEDFDDIKRKHFHDESQAVYLISSSDISSPKKSPTCFQDLPNEIIYEIFKYFDFYYIYETFSNLNKRFIYLTINSNLPITIVISFASKSNFQHFYTDIVKPYPQRIKLLHIKNPLVVNMILTSQDTISKLTQLETLILNNVASSYLRNLEYLKLLPRLSSLITTSDGYTNIDQAEVYHQIFQLPVLKYFKVLLGIYYMPMELSLPVATDKYSSIEHLVIKNHLHFDTLYVILSYVPQLRRLSILQLLGGGRNRIISRPIVLKYLTHVSLQLASVDFYFFKQLIKELFYNVQVLHFSTRDDATYLDADRWQNLILSHMPKLNIFNLEYIYFACSNEDSMSIYNNLIEKFTSSFWIERKWFFSTQYPREQNPNYIVFYSIKPYQRKVFRLNGLIKENISFNAVDHIDMKNMQVISNCMSYFPNTTKLTFTYNLPSIGNDLSRIIPVKQITRVVIDDYSLSFMQLIQLLNVTVNIHTLTLKFLSVKEINFTIRENITFQLVSTTNVVKNLILKNDCSLEKTELLIALCPRLQHFTINECTSSLLEIIELLLSKNHNDNRYLSSLCILEMTDEMEEPLKDFIETKELFNDFSVKFIDGKVYLWW